MQNTTNYNLNKPDGNDFAKIQALNENADIIDGKLKDLDDAVNNIDFSDLEQSITNVNNRLATHLDDDTLIKHKARQISVVNPETQGIQDMQAFAETLFTDVSNGKQLIGTAITDIDTNKTVPTNPTFQNLADLIRGITLGKKYSKGTVSSNSSTLTVTVSGLSFTPGIIVMWRLGSTSIDPYGVYVSLANSAGNVEVNHIRSGNSVVGTFTTQTTGFTAGIGIGGAIPFSWIAFE